MKLVFPGGEHPQVLLGLGVNRVGSDPECQVVLDRPGVEPRLCQLHVTGQGAVFGRHVPVNGTVTFGRAPECTVSVDESGLSRLHGRLQAGDGALLFEDMGSSNGSFVNGRRVLRAEVKAGDEISMDTLRFRVVSNLRVETPPAQQRKPAVTRWWWLGLAVLAVAVCVGIWAGVTGQLG